MVKDVTPFVIVQFFTFRIKFFIIIEPLKDEWKTTFTGNTQLFVLDIWYAGFR